MTETTKRVALAACAGLCFGALSLLAANPPHNVQATPQTWALLAIIGSAAVNGLAIIGFYFSYRGHRREEEESFERRVRRVTREYHDSEEVKRAHDQRIKEMANDQIDAAFADRSPTFVSTARYDERNLALNDRLMMHEASFRSIHRKIDALPRIIRDEITYAMSGRIVSRDSGNNGGPDYDSEAEG